MDQASLFVVFFVTLVFGAIFGNIALYTRVQRLGGAADAKKRKKIGAKKRRRMLLRAGSRG